MSPSLNPREYQRECMVANFAAFSQGLRRVANVLPTGTGKTVVFTHMAVEVVKGAVDYFLETGERVAVLLHRDELIKQTERKIRSISSDISIGVVKAKRHEVDADIVLISIQTLSRSDQVRLQMIPANHFGMVIVDECHHVTAQGYMNALTWFGVFDPDRRTVMSGFTATLGRADKAHLGDVFQDVVYRKDILWAIRNKYLVDVRAKVVYIEDLHLDTTVKMQNGDTQIKSLGAALMNADIGKRAVEVAEKYLRTRQTVWFFPNVETSQAVADALNAAGHPAALVTGATSEEDRALIYKGIETGEVQHLVNCMVLTEGFDAPNISAVVNGRNTTNDGLYQQMVGRGLRLPEHGGFPDSPYLWMRTPKTDCLALDLVGITEKLSLASIADLTETRTVPEEDETLEEAVEREAKQRGEKAFEPPTEGELKDRDVELFGRSSSAWKRTRKGYWFLATEKWYVVMYPETVAPDTLFRVGQVWKASNRPVPGEKRPKGKALTPVPLTRGYGMAWAESAAQELSDEERSGITRMAVLHRKDAAWKKKKEKPTEAQLSYARRLHIVVPDGTTKAELSDLIDVVVASRQLDNYGPKEE